MSLHAIVLEQVKEIRKTLNTKVPASTEEFIGFANEFSQLELARGLKLPKGIVQAHAQRELYDGMWTLADGLFNDRFRAEEGLSARLVVGAKGIGKSTAMRTFVTLIEAVNPQIIGVYVDLRRVPGSLIGQESLLPILIRFLTSKRGLTIGEEDPFDEKGKNVFEALERESKYLFIIVDELDQLYKIDPSGFPNGHTILYDIMTLGATRSGRIATLICGSSAVMADLIRAKSNIEFLRNSFPLIKGAPNLNVSKFRVKRITSSLPTDVKTVLEILRHYDPNATLEKARCVTFIAGSTVRSVKQVLEDSTGDFEAVLGADTQTDGFRDVDEESNKLLESITDKLISQNDKMLKSLSVGLISESAASLAWEAEFKPLKFVQVEELWKNMKPEDDVEQMLEACLFNLSDRSRIVIHGTVNSSPEYIYPVSIFKLYGAKLENKERVKGFADLCLDRIKRNGSGIVKEAMSRGV